MYCVVGFNLQVQRCKVQGKLDMTGGVTRDSDLGIWVQVRVTRC